MAQEQQPPKTPCYFGHLVKDASLLLSIIALLEGILGLKPHGGIKGCLMLIKLQNQHGNSAGEVFRCAWRRTFRPGIGCQ